MEWRVKYHETTLFQHCSTLLNKESEGSPQGLNLGPVYMEKLSRVEGSPAYPSYPGRANFSYISLQNLANRLHEKQKVGSARRVTRLAGSPFCDGRVTLLAGPTFLHINTLARLAVSTPSRRDIQSMRELCFQCSWLGQRGQLFSHINTW